MVAVAGANTIHFSSLGQAFGRELADGLQHPVAWCGGVCIIEEKQRPIDKRCEHINTSGRTYSRRVFQVESAREYRALAHERALRIREKVVAPIEGRSQG